MVHSKWAFTWSESSWSFRHNQVGFSSPLRENICVMWNFLSRVNQPNEKRKKWFSCCAAILAGGRNIIQGKLLSELIKFLWMFKKKAFSENSWGARTKHKIDYFIGELFTTIFFCSSLRITCQWNSLTSSRTHSNKTHFFMKFIERLPEENFLNSIGKWGKFSVDFFLLFLPFNIDYSHFPSLTLVLSAFPLHWHSPRHSPTFSKHFPSPRLLQNY